MLLKFSFLFFYYFSYLKCLDSNLSEKLESLLAHSPLNLTLETHINYYIDSFFDFKGDEFYLIGNENIISLIPQTTNDLIFSFIVSKKVFFSNISLVYEGKDSKINSIFSFENAETIIFEVIKYSFFFLIY